MIQYSHQNSLAFGYNEQQFVKRSSMADELFFTLRRCSREPESFPLECENVARMMQTKATWLDRPIYLLLSGGMDSEVMVESFLRAGVPFTPITFRFKNGLNSHEMQYVQKFSAYHGLDVVYYELDILPYLQSEEAAQFFKESCCWELAMVPHMKLLHHIWVELGGMPVIGGGDVVLRRVQGAWHLSKYEYMLAWYWFCVQQNIDGGVAFFQHTPEITLAMLREPRIVQAATGQNPIANRVLNDLRQVKYQVYREHWPHLQIRPKSGGTEMIHSLIHPIETRLRQGLRHDAIWSTPYQGFCDSISARTNQTSHESSRVPA